MRRVDAITMWLALGLASGCYGGSASGTGETDAEGTGGASAGTADDGSGGNDDDNPVPDDLEPSTVPKPLVARLNDTHYAYTILDLFGEELSEQERGWLPRDVPIEGDYSTSAEAQGLNTQHVLGYAYIARSLSERLDASALLDQHGGCQSVEPDCLESFVEGLGLRTYRRPLTGEEVEDYLQLAETIASEGSTTDDDVVRGLVQAMLQSPAFLYRVEAEVEGEPDEVRRVTGWELASRLSYFLWQSAPDDELLAFAAGAEGDGDYDPGALPEQVERMVADPRFARARRIFWGDYSLASAAPFSSVGPALAEELEQSLMASFERLSGVDADPMPLSALFDGGEMVMSPGVAELAGVEPQGDGLEVYDDVPERLGLITHPGFLAAIGTTSFVGRGVFMTRRLLCQRTAEVPDDPESQAMIEDTMNETEDLTPREASEFRFGLGPVCQSCHTQFEPIAYAFERYDLSGRYAATDAEGRELFSDGVLPPFGDRPEVTFGSAPELLGELAELPEVSACLVENMLEFAGGGRVGQAQQFIRDIQSEYDAQGQTFDALVSAVAGNDRITFLRSVEP